MFVTIGAEQFGTNLKATAATTIPNMMRGTVVIMTTLFVNLKQVFSVTASAMLIGLLYRKYFRSPQHFRNTWYRFEFC